MFCFPRLATIAAVLMLASVATPGFAAPPAQIAAAERTQSVAVPGGLPVSVHFTDELSSEHVKPGDKFSFQVVSDVRVNGWLVFAAGSQGIGEVADAEQAGGNGHAGRIKLQFDYLYAADGEKVHVTQVAVDQQGAQDKGKASTATIGSYLVFGPLGLFAHNFVRGREVVVPPSKQFTIYVQDTVHVQSGNYVQTGTSDGFAR